MYTKHCNPSCDGLHFATFMFLLVHRLCGCQREFQCTRLKVEVVDAGHIDTLSPPVAFKSNYLKLLLKFAVNYSKNITVLSVSFDIFADLLKKIEFLDCERREKL